MAEWNRIQLLKNARERAGAETWVQWVHSHVDDQNRNRSRPRLDISVHARVPT